LREVAGVRVNKKNDKKGKMFSTKVFKKKTSGVGDKTRCGDGKKRRKKKKGSIGLETNSHGSTKCRDPEEAA